MSRFPLALLAGLIGASMPALTQPRDGLRVQLLVDERAEAAARHVGYRLQGGSDALQLSPKSDALMLHWQGEAVLSEALLLGALRRQRSWPVLLVLDLSNESPRALQVVDAYVQVESSMTEPRPLIELDAGQGDSFAFYNRGWGPAANALLTFAFGAQRPATDSLVQPLGSLGAVRVLPDRALATAVPGLAQLRERPPACPTIAQVPDCLAQLQRAPALRGLQELAYAVNGDVMTKLIGTLSYEWRDAAGGMQTRTQPVDIALLLFRFQVARELLNLLAAPSREEEGYAPIALQLDRSGYRLPLPYRPLIGAGRNQRLQLTLTAPKASRHRFRVVVESSDGRRTSTEPIELLYFVPQLDSGEPRLVR